MEKENKTQKMVKFQLYSHFFVLAGAIFAFYFWIGILAPAKFNIFNTSNPLYYGILNVSVIEIVLLHVNLPKSKKYNYNKNKLLILLVIILLNSLVFVFLFPLFSSNPGNNKFLGSILGDVFILYGAISAIIKFNKLKSGEINDDKLLKMKNINEFYLLLETIGIFYLIYCFMQL